MPLICSVLCIRKRAQSWLMPSVSASDLMALVIACRSELGSVPVVEGVLQCLVWKAFTQGLQDLLQDFLPAQASKTVGQKVWSSRRIRPT